MTLCIAAVCQEGKDKKIVLCTDWHQETALAHSETADKLRVLPNGWVALIADTLSRAEELVALYESHLRPLTTFTDDAYMLSEMRKPVQKHKEILANEYISQMLGMSYGDFLNRTASLPEDFVTKRLDEVCGIKLGAALILACFVEIPDPRSGKLEPSPYLFIVDDQEGHQDVVRLEDNFAVIGSGAYVAIPALNQRELDSDKSLMETIYAVYEAKTLAEIVPGVGETTSIDVMEPNEKMWSLSDDGHDRCYELFQKLGPRLKLSDKKKSELFGMENNFLEPFDSDDSGS